MKNFSRSLLLFVLLIIFNSCATLLSKSSYPLTVNTSPSQANITILNEKGMEIYRGVSPSKVPLKAGAGFFKKAAYQLKITKEGYEDQLIPINFKLDNWYFLNLLGNGIGLLIIDPMTGAMFQLEQDFVNATLTANGDLGNGTAASTGQVQELQVYTLEDIPKEWNRHLVEIYGQ